MCSNPLSTERGCTTTILHEARLQNRLPLTLLAFARDHPWVDGNKRTAYLVTEAFCNLNAWRLEADDAESIIIFRALAAGDIQEEGLAKWFERHLEKTR
jgi:prophage maintenance system killer protein